MAKTFGSVELSGDTWTIKCDPFVRTRAKRLFAQLAQHASSTLFLSNTDENTYELNWFLARYPMVLSAADQKYMKQCVSRYEEHQADVFDIIENSVSKITEFELNPPPYDYQKLAANLLFNVKGYLLGDDVGLGKTVSAICAMTRQECLPALIVTLPHLQLQVQREINKFAPQLNTHIIKQTKNYKLHKPNEPAPHVIIISYSKLNAWADQLAEFIRFVTFDEIQDLRTGEGSNKYAAAQLICSRATYKLGLSATPIYNYGNEFFNIINILREGALGTQHEFLREWCHNEKKIKEPQAFGAYLRNEGLMLRRTREDVKREIPPLRQIPFHINSDLSAFNKIQGRATELASIILSTSQNFKGQKLRASEEFNQLMRQATGIAKAIYVAEFVNLLVESGESVVLFGWHREVYSIWMQQLKQHNPVLYTGSESNKQKDEAKLAFMEDRSKVLIVSLRSGQGLDGLQYHPKCSTLVFGELDWSAGVHEQCEGRLGRDGQSKNVLAYYLLAESGSDPVIADTLNIKQQQLDGVRTLEGQVIERLEGDPNALKRLAAAYLDKNKAKEMEVQNVS